MHALAPCWHPTHHVSIEGLIPPAVGHGGADKFHLGPFLEGGERDLAQRPSSSPFQSWTTLKDHSRRSLRCLPRSQQLLLSGNCQHSSPRMCSWSHVYHELGPGQIILWSFLFLEYHCLLPVLKASSGSRKGWSTNVVSPPAYSVLAITCFEPHYLPYVMGLLKFCAYGTPQAPRVNWKGGQKSVVDVHVVRISSATHAQVSSSH